MRVQNWATLPDEAEVGYKLINPDEFAALVKENAVLKNTIIAFIKELKVLEGRIKVLEDDN